MKVVPLRSARRFTVPLLAAAACIVLILGIVLGNQLLSSGQSNRPPATVQPTPTHLATRTMSSESRSAAPGTTTSTATRNAPQTSGAAGSIPSWLKQLPASTGAPHGFHPASIDFTDVNTGWVIGDAKCPTGDQTGCPALIHTTDGGTTWKQLSVPRGPSSSTVGTGCAIGQAVDTPCVDGVAFAGDRVGYLWSGNRTYVTNDGGTSWTDIPKSQGTANFLVFGNRAIRTRYPSGDLQGGPPPIIESAPLGATAFTVVPFPGAVADHYGTGSMIAAAGKHAVFAVRVSGPHTEQIIRSQDGASWRQWASGDLCGGGLTGGGFPAADPIGALDGSLLIGCSGTNGSNYVKVSAAGSKTFRKLRKLPGTELLSVYFGAATSATDFSVATIRTDGAFQPTSWYRTHDGGASWIVPLAFPQGFAGQPRTSMNPAFPLDQVSGGIFALAAGPQSELEFSLDGGASWQIRSF